MNFKYYPDSQGGFIATEDGQTQICDFRQGMGEKHGHQIATALNASPQTTKHGLTPEQIHHLEPQQIAQILYNSNMISAGFIQDKFKRIEDFANTLRRILIHTPNSHL